MQLTLSTISLVMTAIVIVNAWYQKQQFYPAVVYVTKSNASMMVVYIQFFAIVFMFGKLLRKIFLGTLRAAEFEHLLERFWYALTETCLAFTVFRNDFNPRFVALFTVLLFLKSFHWLAEERVDIMERSPVLAWLFHLRVISLLMLLGLLDYHLIMHSYYTTVSSGPSVQLVFGFEYAILLTIVTTTAIKYVLHSIEMHTDTQWENKAVFLLYTELFIGLIKVILYVIFVVIMTKFYALPMFVFRQMFFTIRNFKKALSDVIMSRRAIRNLNTLYPDATPEELQQSDNICIICREDMVNHSKKLPCGHIFHSTCLRSWFQRQQTCPTCRLNILRTTNTNSSSLSPQELNEVIDAVAAGALAGNVNAPEPAPSVTHRTTGNLNTSNTGNSSNNSNGNTNPTTSTSNNNSIRNPFEQFMGSNVPGLNASNNGEGVGNTPLLPPQHSPPMQATAPFLMPPFPFMMPYAVPLPPMPSDFTTFTEEELRTMEGNERQHIEARLELLSRIRLMMDAVDVLMYNYQIVSSRSQNNMQPTDDPLRDDGSATQSVLTDQPSSSSAAMANRVRESASSSDRESEISSKVVSTEMAPSSSKAKSKTITTENNDSPNVKGVTTSTGMKTSPQLTEDNQKESTQIDELRKLRLKFLDEQTRTTTTRDD